MLKSNESDGSMLERRRRMANNQTQKSKLVRLITYIDEESAKRIQHAAVDARLSVSTFLGHAALQMVERMEAVKKQDKTGGSQSKKGTTMEDQIKQTSDVSWLYKGYEIMGTPSPRESRGRRTNSYDWYYAVRDAKGAWMHDGRYSSLDAAREFIDTLTAS